MGWVRNAEEGVLTDGPMITGVASAMAGAAMILVALRMYVRVFLIRAFGHDDWLIVVSLIGACGYAASAIVQTTWGLGLKRLEDMPDQNLINFGKWQYTGAPCYVLGLYGFKMSLLFSYMRFVPRPYYIACVVIAVMITMAHIAFVCCFLFICIPIAMQWDPSGNWPLRRCRYILPYLLSPYTHIRCCCHGGTIPCSVDIEDPKAKEDSLAGTLRSRHICYHHPNPSYPDDQEPCELPRLRQIDPMVHRGSVHRHHYRLYPDTCPTGQVLPREDSQRNGQQFASTGIEICIAVMEDWQEWSATKGQRGGTDSWNRNEDHCERRRQHREYSECYRYHENDRRTNNEKSAKWRIER